MPVRGATADEEMEFPFAQETIQMAGRDWTFRELSVQENDDAADGARDKDGLINGRTMMRLTIMASAVEPKITTKMLAKMPTRMYAQIYEVVNRLQNPPEDESDKDEDKGNS